MQRRSLIAVGSIATSGVLAGWSGAIGPDLDATSPSVELVVERVTSGQGAMPAFKTTLSQKEIQDVATYVSSVAGDT